MSKHEKKQINKTAPRYGKVEVDARKMYGYTLASHPYVPDTSVKEFVDNFFTNCTRSPSGLITIVEDATRTKGGGSSYACEIWIADAGSGMDADRLDASNTWGSHTHVPPQTNPDDFVLGAFGIGGTTASAWWGKTKITLTKQIHGEILKSTIQLDNREDFPGDTPIPLEKLTLLETPTAADKELWQEEINRCFPNGTPTVPSNLTQGTFIRIADFHQSRQSYKALPLVKSLVRHLSETYAEPLSAGKNLGVRRLKRNLDGTLEEKGAIHWCKPADVTYKDTYIDEDNMGALRRAPKEYTVNFPYGSGAEVTFIFTHLDRAGYAKVNQERSLHKEMMSTTACAGVRRCGRVITSGWQPATLFPASGGQLDRLRVLISYDDISLDGYFGVSPYKDRVNPTPETMEWLRGLEFLKDHKGIARKDMAGETKSKGKPSQELQKVADTIAGDINANSRGFDMKKRQATPSDGGRGKDTKKRKPKTNVGTGNNKVYRKVQYRIHVRDPFHPYAWLDIDDHSYDPIININIEAPVVKELFNSDLTEGQKTHFMQILAAPLLAELKMEEDVEPTLFDDLRMDATKYLKNFQAANK